VILSIAPSGICGIICRRSRRVARRVSGAAHWRLGLVFEKRGQNAEAIREIELAVKLQPQLEPAKKDLKRLKG
jgi:hypothetical protein